MAINYKIFSIYVKIYSQNLDVIKIVNFRAVMFYGMGPRFNHFWSLIIDKAIL